jgi:serine/threonine protein kinase/Tol biopolymer transport system component
MSLAAGTRLGPYEIVAPIGAGGMGEVYKAKDTRLERTVAVKVLPQHLSASPEIRQRFEREAKTISQLSHSNICALYDVGNADGVEYLVMELLEGETLSDRLAKGALPLEQTLRYGTQIADALDKAHRQGIVHRDLKPGNVMITKSGVKLLDFGLAKAMTAPAPQSGLTSLPTVLGSTPNNLTQEGTILGTFQYMAPEQLEGRDADGRTDIFSFGCVLYEMATGRKAFSGATQASLISSIMKEEPAPISSVTPMTPPALDRVVRRCLAKDPEDRWQNAGDLGSELKWIAEGGSQSGIPAPVSASSRRRAPWIPAIAALVVGAAGFAAAWMLHRPAPPQLLRASIELPPKMDLDPQNTALALSPDGLTLVMVASGADGKRQIWVRRVDGFTVQPLAGTDDATCPFWSPDSKFIGFFADQKLKKVPATGGTVQTICDAVDGRGGSWSVRDIIAFAPAPFGGLSKVSAAGGSPTPLTRQDKQGFTDRLPWFLPDGKRLLFFSGSQTSDRDKTSAIDCLDVDSGKTTVVVKESSEGRYAAPGYLLFVREGNLMAQPFDASNAKTIGEAVPVAEHVRFTPARWSGNFSVSQTGLLVFHSGGMARRSQLTWFDLEGKEIGKVGDPVTIGSTAISPDVTRAAVTTLGGPGGMTAEVWLYDLVRGVSSRFVFGGQGSFFPVWSPDGRQVAYGDVGGGIAIKSADGTSEPKLVWPAKTNTWPLSWSPDGKFIVFRLQDPKTGGLDLWLLSLGEKPDARPLIATPAEESSASISPSGAWMAYTSNESGRREVYVVPFPALGEKRQVSTAGGSFPGWLGDRQVYFVQPPDNKLVAVDVELKGASLAVGAAHQLFGGKPLPRTTVPGSLATPLSVSPDGKRLLIIVPLDEESSPLVRVVSDWVSEIKKK